MKALLQAVAAAQEALPATMAAAHQQLLKAQAEVDEQPKLCSCIKKCLIDII